ncbi:hypothetical protein GCM10023219_01360 [Stakelama sediminis]|uniref:Uncharacterized protein n=1 Tax=Stakelama sediminis TaxID=463200 RepID=A0A840Z0D0_9SPHN|nr:hypothetical protein [Stakelama sediminis]MBB5719428.1 hypothetical protein [Stakelama sediminis]
MSSSHGDHAPGSPVSVETPRVYDGLGSALRDAYRRDKGLPNDMMDCLARLDAASGHTKLS